MSESVRKPYLVIEVPIVAVKNKLFHYLKMIEQLTLLLNSSNSISIYSISRMIRWTMDYFCSPP